MKEKAQKYIPLLFTILFIVLCFYGGLWFFVGLMMGTIGMAYLLIVKEMEINKAIWTLEAVGSLIKDTTKKVKHEKAKERKK